MKNFSKYLAFLGLFIIQQGLAQQQTLSDFDNLELMEEQAYIHYNSSFLMPGESLFYRFYNINKSSGRKSEISKIGRVVLTDNQGETIFTHVLNLENGASYSDFLIPSNLKTGVYKLVGYTNWMTNYESPGFFKDDIFIFNPYMNNPEIGFTDAERRNTTTVVEQNSPLLNIDLDKNTYGFREKVILTFNGVSQLKDMDVSVSVRKIDDIISLRPKATVDLDKSGNTNFAFKNFPEYRGRSFRGSVSLENGESLSEKVNLLFAVKNKPEKFRVISTNSKGEYNFQVSDVVDYGSARLIVQKNDRNYNIQSDSVEIDLSELEFPQANFPNLKTDWIKKRMVHHQIDRYYSGVKADSIISFSKDEIFYGSRGTKYLLDDYTRFNTMNETFIEVIQLVSFQGKKDNPRIIISSMENPNTTGSLPMVLIDGVPVSNHKQVYDLDAKKVESITVLEDRYYYGPSFYQGLLDIRTKEEFSTEVLSGAEIKTTASQQKKQYYHPDYTSSANQDLSRVPDFRYQLLWLPEVSSNEIEFFTSDVPGNYEIRIEGFSKNGSPISATKQFLVEEAQ